MQYFNNYIKGYDYDDETWIDDFYAFLHWLDKKGGDEFRKYYKMKNSSAHGQMIIPQDSPHWHMQHLFPDFETAYAAYVKEKHTNYNIIF